MRAPISVLVTVSLGCGQSRPPERAPSAEVTRPADIAGGDAARADAAVTAPSPAPTPSAGSTIPNATDVDVAGFHPAARITLPNDHRQEPATVFARNVFRVGDGDYEIHVTTNELGAFARDLASWDAEQARRGHTIRRVRAASERDGWMTIDRNSDTYFDVTTYRRSVDGLCSATVEEYWLEQAVAICETLRPR